MRVVFGIREADLAAANTLLEENGYGPNSVSCKVRNLETDAIGYACSWIMDKATEDKVTTLLGDMIVRKGVQPDRYTFDQLLAANGYARVVEDAPNS